VQRVVVLADGAAWIWLQARCQLACSGVEVVEILDFYHASQHLAQAAVAAYGAQSEVGRKWLDIHCHLLRHQGVAPVLAALAGLQARDDAGADVLRRVHGYVEMNAARMNYPAFRERLFPIGSGAIESTVKNLIQQRQTLAGMRWTGEGAHAVANLRALHRSLGRWATFWQTMPLRRAQALRAPTAPVTLPTQQAACAPAPPQRTSPPDATPPTPLPTATRIQSTGKPWSKGKDYWRRSRISPQRPA
jgi:hypothetical protein